MTDAVSWDPRAAGGEQVAAHDELRARCPLAHSEALGWTFLRHADVVRVARDHETFSSVVSTHLNVPDGLDPPEHTVYRALVDRYFTPELVADFEPRCRAIAADLVGALGAHAGVVRGLAEPYALLVQSSYLGWPGWLEGPLRAWIAHNREATATRDRAATAAVAREFEGYVTTLIAERRAMGPAAPDDLTTRLLGDRVAGRPLTDPELVSILRNWTVGELGTIAASVGIVVHYLAARPDVQAALRLDPGVIAAAVDEILRIDPPFLANRRVVTRPVEIAGRAFEPGDRVSVLWASADRDEDVFGDPDEFRLGRPPADNLLYGTGIHWCPGAPLARLELRVLVEELLAATTAIELDPAASAPVRAAYPGLGFERLPVLVR